VATDARMRAVKANYPEGGIHGRFLTGSTNEPSHKLHGPLQDFKKEHPHTEFRVAANPRNLHDRYVVTQGQLLIIGHGLKDIGGKESFMIRIGEEIASDLIKETINIFDSHWSFATLI
jgi:hypothetical protein